MSMFVFTVLVLIGFSVTVGKENTCDILDLRTLFDKMLTTENSINVKIEESTNAFLAELKVMKQYEAQQDNEVTLLKANHLETIKQINETFQAENKDIKDKLDEIVQNITVLATKLDVFLTAMDTANSSASCSDSWVRYENSCYFFGNTDLSFSDAVSYCIGLDADLTNLETVSESVWLEGVLRNLKAPKHWIAMTDEQKEGIWTHYPSGEPTTFVRWGSGEPNQGTSANCLAIWESFNYLWVDEPCKNRFRPICERG